MKKRLIALILALCVALSLAACMEEGSDVNAPTDATQSDWVVYWYLCGSNLETDGGCATNDLMELLEVELPENVRFVIETGGAAQWQNNAVDASKIQRFVYDSNGLMQVDEQPLANMGDASTLEDFLSFASTYYPGGKTMVLFWDHGGGTVAGAAADENYGNDALTLEEMHSAFDNVFDLSAENPPLEVVGFDTCLMATIDVADCFSDIAGYLVASEEWEPGNGWYYTGWAEALAEDPAMDGAALGQAICDSYYYGCEQVGTADSITLSVTDLSNIPALVEAYDALGGEALNAACQNTSFFSQFGRAALSAENYGGNTREQGYTNMVDLGDLVRNSENLLPENSDAVLSALEDCVVYSVNGPYRAQASGLSCYYSYNGDIDDLVGYNDLGAGSSFKCLYTYGLTGELPEESLNFLQETDYNAPPALTTLLDMGWDDAPLTVDSEGSATLTLGKEANDILASIGFQLYLVDEENDEMLLLGTDNDIVADWQKGVFKDNFRGVWGSIDGCIVYMELSYEGEDYNLYSVPVLLNGGEYNLMVVYHFDTESWEVLGARKGLDENGLSDKELYLLQEGDEITTIHYLSSFSDEDEGFTPYEMETITVTADTVFAESPLPDGTYALMFEMVDSQNNTAYSQVAVFTMQDGEIYTSV